MGYDTHLFYLFINNFYIITIYTKLLSNEKSEMFKKKYKILSKAKGYKDLGYVFDYDNSLSCKLKMTKSSRSSVYFDIEISNMIKCIYII